MQLVLTVRVDGEHFTGGVRIDVPEMLYYAFEPLKTADDAMAAIACGELMADTESVRKVLRLRSNAAEILSKKITNLLLNEMKKLDTHNGYARENGQLG